MQIDTSGLRDGVDIRGHGKDVKGVVLSVEFVALFQWCCQLPWHIDLKMALRGIDQFCQCVSLMNKGAHLNLKCTDGTVCRCWYSKAWIGFVLWCDLVKLRLWETVGFKKILFERGCGFKLVMSVFGFRVAFRGYNPFFRQRLKTFELFLVKLEL